MLIRRSVFIHLKRLCFCRTSSTTTNATNADGFEITAALALYRAPIIAPSMTEVEKRFVEITSKIEEENSFKSNFELKLQKDYNLIEKRKILESEGRDLSELDEEIGISNIQLLNEWADEGDKIIEQLHLNNIDRDGENDPVSIHRKIDRKLILLVREIFFSSENSSPWILPQLKNNGESLRETVEKCLKKLLINNLNIRILGNAPFAYYKHVYPKPIAEKTNSNGNHIFFYSAEIQSEGLTKPNLNKDFVSEYSWCTPDEVKKLIKSKKYKKCIDTILYE